MLTFKHNFIKRASYHSEFIRQGFTYLNHQWNADNSLCLMLCLWHIMIQFFVEAIKLDLHGVKDKKEEGRERWKAWIKGEGGGWWCYYRRYSSVGWGNISSIILFLYVNCSAIMLKEKHRLIFHYSRLERIFRVCKKVGSSFAYYTCRHSFIRELQKSGENFN